MVVLGMVFAERFESRNLDLICILQPSGSAIRPSGTATAGEHEIVQLFQVNVVAPDDLPPLNICFILFLRS